MWVTFLVVLSCGFFSRLFGVPPSTKINLEKVEQHLHDMCHHQSLFSHLLVILCKNMYIWSSPHHNEHEALAHFSSFLFLLLFLYGSARFSFYDKGFDSII